MRYRDRDGQRRMESTFTEDWQEAQKRLRERLQARDDKILDIIRRGEQLTFKEWAEYFLENYSKPPMRAQKTHEANMRAVKHLDGVFSARKLPEITADEIESYLRLAIELAAKGARSVNEAGALFPAAPPLLELAGTGVFDRRRIPSGAGGRA